MKAKINQLTLIVKNQTAALDFYTNKVGFEKKTDYTAPWGYRWVTVGPQGQDFELALFEEGSKEPNGWSSNWHPGNNPPVVMWVEDCKGAFAELKSRGVEFKQAQPEVYQWGISATFSDPDGNLFSMNQRPDPSAWKKQ